MSDTTLIDFLNTIVLVYKKNMANDLEGLKEEAMKFKAGFADGSGTLPS